MTAASWSRRSSVHDRARSARMPTRRWPTKPPRCWNRWPAITHSSTATSGSPSSPPSCSSSSTASRSKRPTTMSSRPSSTSSPARSTSQSSPHSLRHGCGRCLSRIVPETCARGRVGEIYGFYLHPDHWRSGLADELMDASIGALVEDGWASARLWVLAENARARRFYERQGWRGDGETQPFPVPRQAGGCPIRTGVAAMTQSARMDSCSATASRATARGFIGWEAGGVAWRWAVRAGVGAGAGPDAWLTTARTRRGMCRRSTT